MNEINPLDDTPRLRLEEVAVKLGASYATIRRMYDSGDLHAVRISAKALRVKPSELLRLMRERENTPRVLA